MNKSNFSSGNASTDNQRTVETVWVQNYLILPSVFIGLFVYLSVLWAIAKNRSKYFIDPFYKICLSLGVNDVIALCAHALTPFLAVCCQNTDNVFVWRAYIGRCFWYNSVYHSLLVATDRLYALALPHKARWSFDNRILNGLLTLSWILSFVSNICVVTTTCSYVRYPKSNEAFYDFTKSGARLHNLIMDLGFQVVILAVILTLYVISGYHVLKFSRRNSQIDEKGNRKRRKNKRKKIQWLYLVQGICVTLPTIFTIVLYHLVFYVRLTPAFIFLIKMFSILFGTLSFYINPFVYLALNSQLRKVIRKCLTDSLRRNRLYLLFKSSKFSAPVKTSNNIFSSEKATIGQPLQRRPSISKFIEDETPGIS